jgi:hypothetical protein
MGRPERACNKKSSAWVTKLLRLRKFVFQKVKLTVGFRLGAAGRFISVICRRLNKADFGLPPKLAIYKPASAAVLCMEFVTDEAHLA